VTVCYIISGSEDKTIRTWGADTGAAVGNPLEGHSEGVWSVAYSPDGRYITSGSGDKTIRTWDAEIKDGVGRPLEGEIASVLPVACSPNGQHIVSGSNSSTTRVSEPILHQPSPSCNPIHTHLCSRPDSQGWVRDSDGGLLYWVTLGCRRGIDSPALKTIPLTSDIRSASLDFGDFAFWNRLDRNFQQYTALIILPS
jgi:WD40 repeat protein